MLLQQRNFKNNCLNFIRKCLTSKVIILFAKASLKAEGGMRGAFPPYMCSKLYRAARGRVWVHQALGLLQGAMNCARASQDGPTTWIINCACSTRAGSRTSTSARLRPAPPSSASTLISICTG